MKAYGEYETGRVLRPVFLILYAMKKVLLTFIALTCLFLLSPSFTPKIEELPAPTLHKEYLNKLDAFITHCETLQKTAVEVKTNSSSVEDLRKHLILSRSAYKEIEIFFEYIDQQGARDFINGAPLPKLERKVPELVVLQPKGLQVLDELIFDEDPNLDEICKQTNALVDNINRMKTLHTAYPLQDRHVFEAMRFEVIRITSLGLTGFDTPLSGNALPEALLALRSIEKAYQPYFSIVEKNSSKAHEVISSALSFGIEMLNTSNGFDSFDRLTFTKNVSVPLYRNLLKAQRALGVENYYEVSNQLRAINFLGEEFFSDDFLNPYYYTGLKPGNDNALLTELGKTLFFDPILSSNNKRACASCHNPDKGFADGVAKSIAMDFEGTVNRNAPTLLNAVYSDRFFHDLRAENLDLQTEHVFYSDKEFDTDIPEILEKLNSSAEYKARFAAAFDKQQKDASITKLQLNYAFASYVLSLRSYNSPIDRYLRGESIELSTNVKNGFNLFMGKAACGTCHFAPTFSGLVPPHFNENESEVLGVAQNPYDTPSVVDPDGGRAAAGILKEESDIYLNSFKTPTVRNITLTAPYMHNGAYKTLEDVMHFYNVGGGSGIGIVLDNQTLPTDSLGLNESELQDLIAFMQALTDTVGLSSIPSSLPTFESDELNSRKVGGEY